MKRLLFAGAAVAALAVALVLALPRLATSVLEDTVRGMGAREVAVAGVDINPVSGRVAVRGLSVAGLGGVERLHLERLELTPHLLLLLHRQAYVSSVDGGDLEVVVHLPEPAADDPARGVQDWLAEILAQWEGLAASPWAFGSQRIGLRDLRVRLVAPTGGETEVVVERLELEGLETWADEHAAHLDIAARVNGAPITIVGELHPFATVPRLEVEIAAEGLDLAMLARLGAPPPAVTAAHLGMASRFTVSRPGPGRLLFGQEGDLGLSGVITRDAGAGTLNWSGTLEATLSTAAGVAGFALTGAMRGQELDWGEVTLDVLSWDGKVTGNRDGTGRYQVAQDHRLAAAGLAYAGVAAPIRLDALEVTGEVAAEVGGPNPVGAEFTGRVSAGPITLSGERMRADAALMAWSGRVGLNPDGAAGVAAEGSLEAGAGRFAAPDFEAEHAGFRWDGRLGWRAADGDAASLSQTARAALDQVRVRLGESRYGSAQLTWEGDLELVLAAAGATAVTSKGTLEVGPLEASPPGLAAGLSLSALRWSGDAAISNLPGEPVPAIHGELDVKDLRLAALPGLTGEHRVGQTRITGLVVSGPDQLGAEGLAFASIDLGAHAGAEPLLHLEGLTLTAPAVAGGTVDIERVTVDGLRARVMRRADGTLAGVTAPTGADSPPGSEATPGAHGAPLAVRVSRIEVTPGATLEFRDASVDPPFARTLTVDELWLADLSHPDTEPGSPWRLAGRVGRYGQLALAGKVRPFAAPLRVTVTGELEQLELPPLSTYTGPALGYSLTAGQMDATLDLALGDDGIHSRNQLTLRGLEVEPLDPATMAELQTELAMPLDSALNMLRDGNNVIRLELPVSGDLHNPRFDLGDAINQALGSAVKKGALTYLSLALQPFGTLIAVAQLADGAGGAVTLDPVLFAPGTREWAAATPEYAARLGGLLRERPELRLKLCPVATPRDGEALAAVRAAAGQEAEGKPPPGDEAAAAVPNAALEALAQARAERVKDLLLQEYGVDGKRVLVCKPRVSDDPEAGARVDIGL